VETELTARCASVGHALPGRTGSGMSHSEAQSRWNRIVGHVQGRLERFRADGNRLEPEQIPDRRACMPSEVAFLGVGPGAATTIGAEDGSRHARKR
jgi:hypothetical protein